MRLEIVDTPDEQINDRVLESTDTTFKGIEHRQMNDRVLESTDTTFKGIGHRQMTDRVLESTDNTFKGIGHRQMNDGVLESTDTTFNGIRHRQKTEDGLSHITACSRHGLEVLLSARNNLISCSIRKRRDRCRRRFGDDAVCRGEKYSDSGICCIGVSVERRRDKGTYMFYVKPRPRWACNRCATFWRQKNANRREVVEVVVIFFIKVVEQSLVKISRSQSFEHAQKTSRGLFWSQTGCSAFLEADRSPTFSISNLALIDRQASCKRNQAVDTQSQAHKPLMKSCFGGFPIPFNS